jgi:hypothetical protein
MSARFGRGLELDDGDLVMDGGRLREVEDVANLTQALTLRVLTPYGSDPFNTGYGLDVTQAFTEPNGIQLVRELLKLNLVRTLGTDPRVRDIRRIAFDDDPPPPGAAPASTEALRSARHRRTWTVQAELETATGAQLTLLVDLKV